MKLFHYNIADSLEGEVYAGNSDIAANEAVSTELENRECLLSSTINVEIREDGNPKPVTIAVRRKVSLEIISDPINFGTS